MGFRLAACDALVTLVAACGQSGGSSGSRLTSPTPGASPASGSRLNSPSPFPTVPSDYRTITDSTLGYTFRFPPIWVDVSAVRGDPPGYHEVTTKLTDRGPAGLGPIDWWFSLDGGYAPNVVIGCGEPAYGDKADTQLDGQPAKLFVRQGWQADPNQWIIDVIAVWKGTCYDLQQISGNGLSRDDAMATFEVIQASFRFGP